MVFRPRLRWRLAAAGIALFGAMASVGVVSDGGGPVAWALGLGVAGTFACIGLSITFAFVRCSADGLTYVHGIRRRVSHREIEGLELGRGSGQGNRLCISVVRRGRRPLRLVALQAYDTVQGRAFLEGEMARMRAALGLPPVTVGML